MKSVSTTDQRYLYQRHSALVFPLLLLAGLCIGLSGCGGGGGGSDAGADSSPDTGNTDIMDPNPTPDSGTTIDSSYTEVVLHIGLENEASLSRINFPFMILADALNWRSFGEEFRQLGALVDIWDTAHKEGTSLPETRNIPLLGADLLVFRRWIEIVRTDWETVGEKCGYGSQGKPNNGCSYNKNLPECRIYVPRPELYADGDENAYHALLGHEMWHCIVGSFH